MYYLHGRQYEEDPSQKLGQGSEGAIFPFPDDPAKCVKIWHPADPKDRAALQVAKYRASKVQAITGLNLKLPEQFILPQAPVDNGRGGVMGYIMRRVPRGYSKLIKLLDGAFRTSNSIGLRDIALLYALFIEDLSQLHKANIIVGDINLGGNMIRIKSGEIERVWVDTDSWSYPKYPCLATTEMFCHPDLYSNLSPGGKYIEPKPHHDAFAFSVQFCLMSLPGAHPFRMGIHPRVASLQDRATKGVTIFDKEVRYPTFAPPPEILSDDLLHELVKRLKRQDQTPLPPSLLRKFASELTDCPQCKEQYHGSRPHCPKCHTKTTIDIKRLAEFIITELYKTTDTILYVQPVGNVLRLVMRVGTLITLISINEQGQVSVNPTTIVALPGARYRFFGQNLVVCSEVDGEPPVTLEIYEIIPQGGVSKLRETTTNGLADEGAVFDTSSRFLYRTAGNTLMCGRFMFGGKVYGEDQVMQVHQTQSWFAVDHAPDSPHEVIFGFDRALRETQWFVIKGDVSGQNFSYNRVSLASLKSTEKLEDFAVHFGPDSVLLVRLTRLSGRQLVRYSIIELDGTIREDRIIGDSHAQFATWENIHSKLHQRASVLHVTTEGVVKQTFASDSYDLIADTRGVIGGGDRLFRFGKVVGVARRNAVLGMRRK